MGHEPTESDPLLHDLEALRRLGRLSTHLTDGRAEVCRAARDLLAADTAVEFERIGSQLESLEVAGVPLPGPVVLPVDDETSMVARVFRDGEPEFARRPPGEIEFAHARAMLAAPVVRGVDRFGVMVWLWRAPRQRPSRYESILVDILLAEKGLAVERQHLLHRRDTRPHQWRRANPVGDGLRALAATLAIVRGELDAASAGAHGRRDAPGDVLRRVSQEVATAGRQMRELEFALRDDGPLIDLGVARAMSALVEEVHDAVDAPTVDLVLTPANPGELDLRPSVLETVYFVVREALRSAVADGARHVTVRLTVDAQRVIAQVEDDGAGLGTHIRAGGRFGLMEMRVRTDLVGGELTVASVPGAGATCTLRIDRPTNSAVLTSRQG